MENNDQLKRTLTLFPSIIIVINAVIGSGIFTIPGEIMGIAKGSGPNLLAWIIAGISCIMMALVYTELGPMFPNTGGPYVYVREAFNKKVAFSCGWITLIDQFSLMAILPIAFSRYLSNFLELSPTQSKLVSSLLICICITINVLGVRLGNKVNIGFTVSKIAALVLLIGGGIFAIKLTNFKPVVSPSAGWGTTISAAVPCILAFGGYNQLAFMSGEIKDPEKNIPRGMLIGMLVVIVFNMLVSTVCTGVLGVDALSQTGKAVSDVANIVFGSIGGGIVTVGALISIFGAFNGCCMSMPRVAYAMALDKQLPKALTKIHSKYETPYVSILMYGLFALLMVWFLDFSTLVLLGMFAGRLVDLLVSLSLVILRKKRPDFNRPLKMWGYPASMIIVLLLTIALFFNIPKFPFILGIIFTLSSIPFYMLNKRFSTN